LIAGLCASTWAIAVGAALVGATAATAYAHNLYYSLEEPGRRARNAGIHEALVGAAFAIPPALSGLAARFTTAAESVFWVGSALALAVGITQNLFLCRAPSGSDAGSGERSAETARQSS